LHMVDDPDFQTVKDSLVFNDIYIKSTNASCADDWDPKRSDIDEVRFKFMHQIKTSEVLTVEENGDSRQYFRVNLLVGCRFVTADDNEEDEMKAQIEATFCAEYLMTKEDVNPDGLKVFALENVSYHVWPYWREYLVNMCSRLNLPKVPLPTRQIKIKKRKSEVDTKQTPE
jgi:hypothetical protein